MARRSIGFAGLSAYLDTMDTPTLLARLKAMEPELREAGVGALYLFGSRARGDHRQGSDIDLAFDATDNDIDLWTRAEIMALVAGSSEVQIDLADRKKLLPRIHQTAESEMLQVF